MTGFRSYRQQTQLVRQGFSLLETLLALTLCTVLLAATWSSIQLYWSYRTRSQDRIAAATLLRAVAEDLQLDIRSVVAPPAPVPTDLEPVAAESTINGMVPMITEREFRERLLELDPLSSVQPVRFAGGSDWVILLSTQDSPRFPVAYSPQRMRHTVWCSAHRQKRRFPIAQAGDTSKYATVDLSGEPHGVARAQLPVSMQPVVNGSGRAGKSVYERLESIAFEYFDGAVWHRSWDSEATHSLPLAIRISLKLEGGSTHCSPVVVAIPQGVVPMQEDEP